MSEMTLNEAIEILKSNINPTPGIILKQDERCYFSSEAIAAIQKTMNVGSVSNGGSIGGYYRPKGSRIGIGARSYNSTRRNVRGTVIDQYPGDLYLTNKRMVLVALKGGFEIPLTKITALEFVDGGIVVASKGKSHIVLLDDAERLKRVIMASNTYTMATQNNPDIMQDDPFSFDASQVVDIEAEYSDPNQKNIPIYNEPSKVTTENKGSKKTGLWIGAIVFAVLALLGIINAHSIRGFLICIMIVIGFLLHIDPKGLRNEGKLPSPGITWAASIGVVVIIMAILK